MDDLAHPHLAAAVAAFIYNDLPVPYRAIARRFGVPKDRVRRLARKMKDFMERQKTAQIPPETTPLTPEAPPTQPAPEPPLGSECPECGTPLEPDAGGRAVCVGCGRVWQRFEGQWTQVMQTETPDLKPRDRPRAPDTPTHEHPYKQTWAQIDERLRHEGDDFMTRNPPDMTE